MNIPSIALSSIDTLSIDQFKKMDFYALENYGLPIELMMENAGLNLAKLICTFVSKEDTILIGIGNGNNGGGGLVAARRLSAWGYTIHLDLPVPIVKDLPKLQLERAKIFGVSYEVIVNPDIWVDAYLGFSQRFPLNEVYTQRINKANDCDCIRLSLDMPTGFLGDVNSNYFKAEHVLSLAALKNILTSLPSETNLYIADLGLPKQVYAKFEVNSPPFEKASILAIK